VNPYDNQFLTQLMGQPETQKLEFKSSRDLLLDDTKRNKFIKDQGVRTVSAFLNTDGGRLVIGIEEKDGVAASLSRGVPRSIYRQERLQSVICDHIQPAVASYISVFSVPVEPSSGEEKQFAFVIDVNPGTTAYQAADKLYYSRRSGQNEAMEDKDIRLGMLAGDKPRLAIKLQPRVANYCAEWNLLFENAGTRTIPRAMVRTKLTLKGLSDNGHTMVSCNTPIKTITSVIIVTAASSRSWRANDDTLMRGSSKGCWGKRPL
jgi:hypothetical protein